MRILIVTTSYPAHLGDSPGKTIHELAYTLVRMGQTVEVVTPRTVDAPPGIEVMDGVSVRRIGYSSYGHSRFDPKCPEQGGIPYVLRRTPLAVLGLIQLVWALLRSAVFLARDCDVIHAQWLPTAVLMALAKPLHRRPVVVTVRGSGMQWAMSSFMTRALASVLCRSIDHFVATSERFHRELKSELGVPERRVTYIPNGIDISTVLPASGAERERLRGEFGLAPDVPCILYVGNMIEEKGIFVLHDAWAEIQRRGVDSHLVLIGHGPGIRRLEEAATDAILMGRLRLLGKRENQLVLKWMRAADVLVLASMHAEGTPHVVNEAMACGLPAIVTPAGGLAEVVKDGVNGFVIPQSNSTALARRLEELLTDPNLREEMGSAARRMIASSDRTIERMVPRVRKVYEAVVSGVAPGDPHPGHTESRSSRV